MARYQIILAYDGTEFRGFQRQKNARTVQGCVEAALAVLGWNDRSILSAGRTDSGVHAKGQSIAFDLGWQHAPLELLRGLNANLPPDIAAREIRQVPDSFHPRFSALRRSYRYHLYCSESRQPLLDRYTWRVWPPVSLERLREFAENLVGTRDFTAFGTPQRAGGSTVRTVSKADWSQTECVIVFEITANAFLYHMVRRLVAYQVKAVREMTPVEEILAHLDGSSRKPLQGLAPAHGLTLIEVMYPD